MKTRASCAPSTRRADHGQAQPRLCPGRARRTRHLAGKTNDFQLVAVMARRKPDLAAHLVALDTRRLIGLAKSCAALSVASCNRGLSDRQEKRWQKLGAQIAEIAGWYGMRSSHH